MDKNMESITKSMENNAILIMGESCPELNYYSRPKTIGKEYEMVLKYIGYIKRKNEKNKQKQVALFVEPQIASGYPDLVIVEYYSDPSIIWSTYRKELGKIELQLLYFIQSHKKTHVKEICELLGFSEGAIRHSLQKLEKCGLVRCHRNDAVHSIKMSKYCRITKIISIEAKIDKWKEAIRQAEINMWFSTESYILLNKEECSKNLLDNCREKGIGIILVNGTVRTELHGSKRRFPVSYASLQFNEWLQSFRKETR